MATIKLKYRASSVKGKDGTLFLQIIHQRQVLQIYPSLHVADDEWDAEGGKIIISSGIAPERVRHLTSVKASIKDLQSKLLSITQMFDEKEYLILLRML